MRQSTLTGESVFEAMATVMSQGEYPSLARVRAVLDSTASQQTLQRHISEQWEVIGKQFTAGQSINLPDNVVAAARTFWREASDTAAANLEEAREALKERESAYDKEICALNDQLGTANDQITELADTKRRLADELDTAHATNQQLHADLRAARDHYKQIEYESSMEREALQKQHDAERKAVEREAAMLRDETTRLERALELSSQRLDSQQAEWAKRVDEARQHERAAREETTSVRQEAAADQRAMQNALDQARELSSQFAREKEALESELVVAETARKESVAARERDEAERVALVQERNALEQKLADERVAVRGAQTQAAERLERINLLTNELAHARKLKERRSPPRS